MNTTNPDQQKQIIQELVSLGFEGPHLTHGLAQDFRCAYCDKDYLASYDAYRYLELDHIIPQSNGGEFTEENTAACCRACNLLKQSYTPVGNSREERIADARRYIKEKRLLGEAEVAKIRRLVRGDMRSTQP